MDNFELPLASKQQLHVVKCLETHNVIIDSVAGCGKTTTNLYIASKFPDAKILLLTYNRKLRLETRAKAEHLYLDNLEVHTYHSFSVCHYGVGKNDSCLIDLLSDDQLKMQSPPTYDILILDETQDMSILYFELVCKIRSELIVQPALCVLGDEKQSIYDFNEADPRFITLADQVFAPNGRDWKRCALTYSFRITDPMAQFINKCMIGGDRIQSKKHGVAPRYIICNCYSSRRTWAEVSYYIDMGYEYEDIFILAASVKKSTGSRETPVRTLANALSDRGIPVYIPGTDMVRVDQSLLRGKLVFTTFHQAKGLERKVIIVMGFDDSYFKFYKHDKNPNVCPNELYVAATRGLEHLTLIHNASCGYLPFLVESQIKKCTYFEKPTRYKKRKTALTNKTESTIVVTRLVKFLPAKVIKKCMEHVVVTTIRNARVSMNIPHKTEQKCGPELVCEITGTAIPAWFEYKLRGTMTIHQALPKYEQKFGLDWISGEASDSDCDIDKGMCGNDSDEDSGDEKDEIFVKPKRASDIPLDMSTDQLLFVACMYDAYASGFKFKAVQIDRYNWLSEQNRDRCMYRMKRLGLSKGAEFEHLFVDKTYLSKYKVIIAGRSDCIDAGAMYEFKCTQNLDESHYLQLLVYMWMDRHQQLHDRALLYNVTTDELVQLECTDVHLNDLVERIMAYKYGGKQELTDQDFVENAHAVVETRS